MNLKTIDFPKRRFLCLENLGSIDYWLSEREELLNCISTEGRHQLMSNEVFFEIDELKNISLMLPVLGVPKVDKKGLKVVDQESRPGVVYNLPETQFEIDFSQILTCADGFRQSFELPLINKYQLVLNNDKIALHFFIQKDYILNC